MSTKTLAAITLTLSLTTLLSACGRQTFSVANPLSAPNADQYMQSNPTPTDPEYCTKRQPEYALNINVAAFQMVDNADLEIGFPASMVTSPMVDMKATFQRGRMFLELEAQTPISKNTVQTVRGQADQKGFGISAKVDLSLLLGGMAPTVDPGYFYTTPLATVTQKALANGVKALLAATNLDPWSGEVLAVQDGLAVLSAGDLSGAQIGDEFAIWNVEQHWDGDPCISHYLGATRTTDAPVAVVKVIDIPNMEDTSFAQVVTGDITEVQAGAQVAVQQLVQPPGSKSARTIKKAVTLNETASQPLALPDGSSYAIQTPIQVLARDAISNGGFMLKNQ